MAWFGREKRASLENPSVPISAQNASSLLGMGFGSPSGIVVSRDIAMRVPAFRSAVLFISWTIASLPLQLFRRNGATRDTDTSDPLYAILHDAVNDETTSFQWRSGLMQNALTEGRGLSFIERNATGRVMNIWPLDPSCTTVERRNGRKQYVYRDSNGTKVYAASEIIDIPWMLKCDGITSESPIYAMQDALGLSKALTDYASRFFQNGGVPPLTMTGPITSPAAAERASADILQKIKESGHTGKNVLVMPAGHEIKAIGFDPDKGQMTDARRFQIEEIARGFNLSPIFLQDLTHGTFSNTEQQDLHVVKHTISQWLKLIEQELNLKLFGIRDATRFVEFNLDGLLRGDFSSRMAGYATAINNAINTPDEVRTMENWPAMGGRAAELMVQGATVPINSVAQQPVQEPTP